MKGCFSALFYSLLMLLIKGFGNFMNVKNTSCHEEANPPFLLEKEGLVTVQRTQKLGDVGQPLIQFTEKAQPYLLHTPEKEKATDVQKVKIADEDLVEITGIKTENDGKDALVEYTTAYKNTTPFSALMPVDFSDKRNVRKARFSLTDNGWKLEK
jgi:hypothetical protein